MFRQQLDILPMLNIHVAYASLHTRNSGLFTIASATEALNGKSKCVAVKYTMNYVQ